MTRFPHDHAEYDERKFQTGSEMKLMTYSGRKIMIGDYLQKIFLMCGLLWMNENTETSSAILIRFLIALFASLAVKKVTHLADKALLKKVTIQEIAKDTVMENKLIIPQWSTQSLWIPITPIQWEDIAIDLILFGLPFIRLSGVTAFSGFYTPTKSIRCLEWVKLMLTLLSVGYDGIINRAIVKENDQYIQKFRSQLIKNEHNRPVKIIRELIDGFFPDEKDHWKTEHESACGCQTLIFLPDSKIIKNLEKLTTFWLIKKLLHYHLDTQFKIEEGFRYISFFLPRISTILKNKTHLIKTQVTQAQPIIQTLRKIYPQIKYSQWEIIEEQNHSTGNSPVYLYLKSKDSIPIQSYEAIKIRFKMKEPSRQDSLILYETLPVAEPSTLKKVDTLPHPSLSTSAETLDVSQKNKSPQIKSLKRKAILEKVNLITQCISTHAILNRRKDKNACLRFKIPIDELQKKLSPLPSATIEKSHQGSRLIVKFSDSIEISIIGNPKKFVKEVVTPPTKSMFRQNNLEMKIAHLERLPEEKKEPVKNKRVSVTVEYSGQPERAMGESLPDKAISVIVQHMAHQLKKLTGKTYDLSDPTQETYDLLTRFIKLSHAIKTLHKALSVRAFGGIWRSLLMEEPPRDIDILVIIPPKFRPQEDLLERLLTLGIISEYRLSNNAGVPLYTICFLNSILEITVFTHLSVEEYAKTLDFTPNVLALEIQRFDSPPDVQLYQPLGAQSFVSAIQKGITPPIDVIINPQYITLLKNSSLRRNITTMVLVTFSDWTLSVINPVIETLIQSPHDFALVKPSKLVFFILKWLSFTHDPKRIFRLLTLYQSNHYGLHSDVESNVLLKLIPRLFNTVTALEEKPVYPLISRSRLFFYFVEYLTKQNARIRTQESPVSHSNLLKAVLMAGVSLEAKQHICMAALLDKADLIYKDPYISQYLSHRFRLLSQYKSTTAVVDLLFIAVTLTQISQIFPTLHYHPDYQTFMQCYLLPTFNKQFIAIAHLFSHIPQEEQPEQKEDALSEVLFNQWQQYSAYAHHFNVCHLFHHSSQRQKTTTDQTNAEYSYFGV